jgi:hypothetical protein
MPTSAASMVNDRDLRIDFLRGLALLFIFIDHIPDNGLAHFTLRNFGFADAAEVFVLLAGFRPSSPTRAASSAKGSAPASRASWTACATSICGTWRSLPFAPPA